MTVWQRLDEAGLADLADDVQNGAIAVICDMTASDWMVASETGDLQLLDRVADRRPVSDEQMLRAIRLMQRQMTALRE